ncbi:neuropeptide Y receptor type 2-like [Tachypleus tridentatus]|uniref:neuropeptide Y receptor type 2-like n=1 Tax=Tachypleus tridentatus TaxID=6853 RepID=UPI003FD358F9
MDEDNPLNKSYFLNPSEKWRGVSRAYFTFYSEFQRPLQLRLLEVVFLSAILMLAVPTNILIMWVFYRDRRMKTGTNFLIINMAVTDLIFAAGIPLIATTRITEEWLFGKGLCSVLFYSQCLCGFQLTWTSTLISVERYRGLCSRTACSKLSTKHTLGLIVALWAIGSALLLPCALFFTVVVLPYENNVVKFCTLIWPDRTTVGETSTFTVSFLLLVYVLPVSWLVYNYRQIFKTLKEHNWGVTTHGGAAYRHGGKTLYELRSQRHLRTVKILVTNVVVIGLMWIPMHVVVSIVYFDSKKQEGMYMHSHIYIGVMCFTLCNTFVNPLLHCIFNSTFKQSLSHLRLWFSRRCNLIFLISQAQQEDKEQPKTPRLFLVNNDFWNKDSKRKNVSKSRCHFKMSDFQNERQKNQHLQELSLFRWNRDLQSSSLTAKHVHKYHYQMTKKHSYSKQRENKQPRKTTLFHLESGLCGHQVVCLSKNKPRICWEQNNNNNVSE